MLGIKSARVVSLEHIGETDAIIEDESGDAVWLVQSTSGEWFMVDFGRACDLRAEMQRDLNATEANYSMACFGREPAMSYGLGLWGLR